MASLIRPVMDITDVDNVFDLSQRMDRLLSQFEQSNWGFPTSAFNMPAGLLTTEKSLTGSTMPRSKMEAAIDFVPLMDLVDLGDKYVLQTDLPGFTKDNVKIETVGPNQIVISGESSLSDSYKQGTWKVKERQHGKFERKMILPRGADLSKGEATFDDGVLCMEIPKKEETHMEKKSIQIK